MQKNVVSICVYGGDVVALHTNRQLDSLCMGVWESGESIGESDENVLGRV